MPNLFGLDFQGYFLFFLILSRVSGVIMVAPVTGSASVPPIVKIHLSLIVALLVFNLVPAPKIDATRLDTMTVVLMVAKETMLGIFIGMVPRILISAVSLGGSFISHMMGLSMASIFDQNMQGQQQVVSVFKTTLLLLVFLFTNAHHVIFHAIILSFQKVPIAGLQVSDGLYEMYVRHVGDLFYIAMRIAFPVMAVLFLTNLIFGFLAKSIPQLNVFIVGMPLSVGLGLIVMALALPVTAVLFQQLWGGEATFLLDLISIIP